jgi:hypothetical protein
MRTIHRSTTTLFAAAALVLSARAASGQTEYPQTLYWGSGLVDIPVAWVSPLSGDFAINYSGKRFSPDPDKTGSINYNDKNNSQLTGSMSLFGRLDLGIAAYTANPEEGFFGRGVVIREEDFAESGTFARLLIPSVAVGIRNVGPYDKIDRFGIGYKLVPPSGTNPNAEHVADSLHKDFQTSNSTYAVATKNISLAQIRANWPDVTFGITAGYGTGLFKNHGSLAVAQYAKHSTGGLFYGVKTDFSAGPNLLLTLMAENNAWDYNVGANLSYRGVRVGIYETEVGAGSANVTTGNPASTFYNYSKFAYTIGWQSNIFALLRGDFLQNRAATLERQRQGLLAEITQRQQRIAALELEINRYEAQNLLELEQRRAQAEAELRAEREALRRLEERLNRVERQTPGATTPPSTTPPSTTPPSTTPTRPPQG